MSLGWADTGFWERLRGRFFGRRTLEDGSSHAHFSGSSSESGANVSVDSALKLSAFWACVNLRASVIGSLPFHLHDEKKQVAKDHPLHRLLHYSPNADMTAGEFWEVMSASMDLWGNGYARIERRRSGIVALTPVNPERVIVRREGQTISYDIGGGINPERVSENDMLHFKGFSLDGLVGLSPLQYAADTIGGLMAANSAASREFKTGMKVGGFLKTTNQAMKDEQRERLRAHLGTFGRPENAGKWMVLEAGVEPASAAGMRINPNDAQLLESRHFGIEEVCRVFSVPPPLIGHTDKASSWASSLENLNRYFLSYGLRPRLHRMEQTIQKKLLSPDERFSLAPRFNAKALMRADAQGQSSFYQSALQNGYMSRNEVRDLEDYPAIPDGDEYTVQLNMTTLGNMNEDARQAV